MTLTLIHIYFFRSFIVKIYNPNEHPVNSLTDVNALVVHLLLLYLLEILSLIRPQYHQII